MNDRRLKRAYYIHISVPLFLGILIYFFFRENRAFDNLLATIPYMPEIRARLYIPFVPASVFGIFFKYHFTDFLWAYSLCWATLYGGKRLVPRMLFCAAFCSFMEAIQLGSFINATFDWWDILSQLAGVLLGFAVYCFHVKQI